MLNCFIKRPIYPFNKNLSDYFRISTNESIRKLIEKQNLERNKPKFKNLFNNDDDDNDKPKFDVYDFLFFLSLSIVSIYIYKRLK